MCNISEHVFSSFSLSPFPDDKLAGFMVFPLTKRQKLEKEHKICHYATSSTFSQTHCNINWRHTPRPEGTVPSLTSPSSQDRWPACTFPTPVSVYKLWHGDSSEILRRRTSAIGNHYEATASEDMIVDICVCVIVICLYVVTCVSKSPINPIIRIVVRPNHVTRFWQDFSSVCLSKQGIG
jgi:hypothetical protein